MTRLALIALTVILSSCDKQEQTAPSPAGPPTLTSDQLVIASVRTIRPGFEYPAVIEALQNAAIRPEVQAPLLRNHFIAGDLIEEGQLLVELDPAKFNSKMAAATAALDAAKASARQAETNWQRAQKLKPKGYISALDFDRARAETDTRQAAVAQAEANVERAALDLSRSKISAPFAGKISRPYHAEGDLVGPLAIEPLFELVQLDPIYATGNVELSIYNNFIALRMKAKQEGVDVPPVAVGLLLAGGVTYPFTGEFVSWSHAAKGSRGTIAGRIKFPNPDGLLLPGQNVTLSGKTVRAVDRVMVPQRAVMQDQQGHYVKVLDSNDTVQRVNIEVGVRDGSDWAVPVGLDEGSRVIAEGARNMKVGTLFNVVD